MGYTLFAFNFPTFGTCTRCFDAFSIGSTFNIRTIWQARTVQTFVSEFGVFYDFI